jgi:hypothetical protein
MPETRKPVFFTLSGKIHLICQKPEKVNNPSRKCYSLPCPKQENNVVYPARNRKILQFTLQETRKYCSLPCKKPENIAVYPAKKQTIL